MRPKGKGRADLAEAAETDADTVSPSEAAPGSVEDVPESIEEDSQVVALRAALYANVGASEFRAERWKETVDACTEGVSVSVLPVSIALMGLSSITR